MGIPFRALCPRRPGKRTLDAHSLDDCLRHDFFNVSGSLFTEMEAHPSIRASAQGLFFMMTNGVGAIIGGYASGAVVDAFSVYAEGGGLVSRDWTPVWLIFAGYALVIGLLFGMVFRYKHNPEKIEKN